MALFLKERGYTVNVITAFPYYPQWKIDESYAKQSTYTRETYRGITIYRYKQYTPNQPSFFKRVVHIIDFTFGSYFNLKKLPTSNIVVSIIPFTSSAFLGNKLAKKHNAKHWIHIQDFEFDAAFQSGLLSKKGIVQQVLEHQLSSLERRILNKADMVSTISNLMHKKLRARTKTKTTLFPNWIDGDQINPYQSNEHQFLSSKKFKVLYAGNIGDKQNWSLFFQVVEQLPQEVFDFVVVGDGSNRHFVEKRIREYANCEYYAPVPLEELSDLLCSADVHILFQKLDVLDTVMPSKILGMMASAKPSLITGHPQSEVRTVIDGAEAGIYISNQNVSEIVESLTELKDNAKRRDDMGRKARNFVLENFSKENILNAFLEQLKRV